MCWLPKTHPQQPSGNLFDSQRHICSSSPNPVSQISPQSRPHSNINNQGQECPHPPSHPVGNISLLCKFPSAGHQLTHSIPEHLQGHLPIMSDTDGKDNTQVLPSCRRVNPEVLLPYQALFSSGFLSSEHWASAVHIRPPCSLPEARPRGLAFRLHASKPSL